MLWSGKRPKNSQRIMKKSDYYGFPLSKKDRLEDIPGKIVTTSVEMLDETLKNISMKEYRRAVEAVLKAENIVIYSVENSVCTANDLLTKLTYLGLNCRIYGDYYLQNVSAVNLTRKIWLSGSPIPAAPGIQWKCWPWPGRQGQPLWL